MMKELTEAVLNPTPPEETSDGGVEQDPQRQFNPTQVWLRRVAFLIAAASPALGCSDPGVGSSGDVCAAYAAKTVTCDYYAGYTQEYVEQQCDIYLAYASQYGAFCHAAYEDYYACVSHLSCATIDGGGEYCTAEGNQVAARCDDGSGSSSPSNSNPD